MEDIDFSLDLLTAPEPKRPPRVVLDTPAPEYHALSWRPAGSASLAERWLKAGEVRPDAVPPKLKRRR